MFCSARPDSPLYRGRMKPGIQREILLQVRLVEAARPAGIEHQVPAVLGHSARNQKQGVLRQQTVAKLLLPCAWNAWPKPVRVWNIADFHHMNFRRIGDLECRQHMADRIERAKSFVDSHFENGGRGVNGCIDSPHPSTVPPSPEFEGSLAAVPACLETFVIKSPAEDFSRPKRTRQRRHA